MNTIKLQEAKALIRSVQWVDNPICEGEFYRLRDALTCVIEAIESTERVEFVPPSPTHSDQEIERQIRSYAVPTPDESTLSRRDFVDAHAKEGAD
jgi:hypothetical protein